MAAECALLVIAHRFSTVRAARQAIVLEQGAIVVAAGAHAELMDTSDYYRSFALEWLDGHGSRPPGPR